MGGPQAPSGLGPGGSSPLGGRKRRGGAPSPSAAGPSPVLAGTRARADLTVPNSSRQVRGLRPAELGTRGLRGLEADWGGAVQRRPNFSGKRGRPARCGREPEPEWGSSVPSFSLCAWVGHMARACGAAACGAHPRADQNFAGCPSRWLRGLSVAGGAPRFGGPRVSVLRVRWGLSWPSAGKREGGREPARSQPTWSCSCVSWRHQAGHR